MTLSPHFDHDDAVFDGTEPVTLRRRGEATGLSIVRALRRAVSQRESDPSDGICRAADVRWHLPAHEVADAPTPGATIVDTAGEVWTVLSVERATLGNRFACACRNLAIAGGLDEFVTLQRAAWSLDPHGAPLPAWTSAGPPLRARVQPIDATVADRHDQPAMQKRFSVFLAETIPLDTNCRLIHDGVAYRITNYERPQRIDELFVVEVEPEPPTA